MYSVDNQIEKKEAAMNISIFLLSLILGRLVYRWGYYYWSLKPKKDEYLISGLSKEEYQQMEKKVKEMLAERENK